MPPVVRVYLEIGKRWTFASAVDWPGWARRARGEHEALDALERYRSRYKAVAGTRFAAPDLEVIGQVPGDATTDFGALSAVGGWDLEPLEPAEAARLSGLLGRAWQVFDDVSAGAPTVLRKGPRGGGRDRDAITDHVREAERSYGRKLGVRVPPRTPWPEQRARHLEALRAGAPGGSWPARYAVRRFAWHVMDHAWEIEDRRQ